MPEQIRCKSAADERGYAARAQRKGQNYESIRYI